MSSVICVCILSPDAESSWLIVLTTQQAYKVRSLLASQPVDVTSWEDQRAFRLALLHSSVGHRSLTSWKMLNQSDVCRCVGSVQGGKVARQQQRPLRSRMNISLADSRTASLKWTAASG